MNRNTLLAIIGILAVGILVIIALSSGRKNNVDVTPGGTTAGMTTAGTTTGTGGTIGGTNGGTVISDMIRVTSPQPNAIVSSPLIITGEARGNWYFEASFPIRLYDANNKLLGTAVAQAQGEWMTTNFVPFRATMKFSTPATATGTLVFEKDNPSGLPQNAMEYRMPVRFQNAQSLRTVQLYYYNPNNDKDANGNVMCSSQGLVAVSRQIPVTTTPIQDTVRLLLRGELTTSERNQGITTEYPLSGVTLKGANLANGTLTIELNDLQNRTSGGSCRAAVLWHQIQATAKQFSGVTTVRYLPQTLFQP